MSHIFISYSRKDLDFAQEIVIALSEHALETWIDWKSIPKGEDWWERIQHGIEEADAFLFLVSPDAAASQVCREEIEHAQRNGKRILPVLIRDTDPQAVHVEISKRNWIYCRQGQDPFQQAIREAVETIRTDYEWLTYHTRLQVKALEWERTEDASRLLRGNELREADEQLTALEGQIEPEPTQLQRRYLLASRRNEERVRRRTIAGLAGGLAVMVVISIFAVQQRNIAVSEGNARATALVNEENARGTAQAEQRRAEEQARIARARELAAQAQLLSEQQAGMLDQSMLLAIESLRLSPSPAAAQFLNQGLKLLPGSTPLQVEDRAMEIALIPDESRVLVRTGSQAFLFDTGNGKIQFQISLPGPVPEPGSQPSRPANGFSGNAFSPDGQWLATVGNDGQVQAWNALTGKRLDSFSPRAPASGVRFSPDGRALAVVAGNRVSVFAFPSGESLAVFDGPAAVTAAAFDRDAQRLAASYGESVQIWDIRTGESQASFPHGSPVKDLAFFDGGRTPPGISTITAEAARLWDIETRALVREIPSAGAPVALSEDGRLFVSAASNLFQVREVESGEERMRSTTVGAISEARFSPNGRRLVIVTGEPFGGPGEASLWEIETGNEIARVPYFFWDGRLALGDSRFFGTTGAGVKLWNVAQEGSLARHLHAEPVTASAFSRKGTWLATAGENGLWLWHMIGLLQLAHFPLEEISALSFSPDDRTLAVLDGGLVHLYSVPSGKPVRSYRQGDGIQAFAFAPDGGRLATASGAVVRIWEPGDGGPVEEIRLPGADIEALSFSDDGAILLAAGERDLATWDLAAGEQLFRASYPTGVREAGLVPGTHLLYGAAYAEGSNHAQVFAYDLDQGTELMRTPLGNAPLAYTEDGGWLATAGEGRVTVWNARNGKGQLHIEPGMTVLDLAFSPDGQRLAVAGGELYGGAGQVVLWDLQQEQEEGRFIHDRVVYAIAFSGDGRYLATGSWDDTSRVWEIDSGQEISRLLSSGGLITDTWFSPDDRWLAYQTEGGGIHISPWNPEDLVRSACELIETNLSHALWQAYFPEEPYRFTC